MLKHYRIKSNLTQKELGSLVDKSFQTISKYEKGLRTPDHDITEKIVKALKLNPKEQHQLHGFFAEVARKRKKNRQD